MDLIKFLLFPRGVLAIILYSFAAFPTAILLFIFKKSNSPQSWGIMMLFYAQVLRFVLANDYKTVRELVALFDIYERTRIYFRGFEVEFVKRKVHGKSVNGCWIISPEDVLPDVQSPDWNGRLVCLWAHGGGFGCGSSLTLASAHCQVMEVFEKLNSAPLLYFSLDYPLGPESKYPKPLQAAITAYYWLVNHVGVKNIVLGGDSAGANLVLALYMQLVKESQSCPTLILPKSIVLSSPWLDISLSHTPPDIIEHLSSFSDYLPLTILEKWRDNITPTGMNPRDPRLSPFFDLNPMTPPADGILLLYGSMEVFAPVLDDWVKSLRRTPELKSKLKVVLGVDMPHNFPLAFHALPSHAQDKSKRALFEIAKFFIRSSV